MKDAIIALVYGLSTRNETELQFALRDLLTDVRHAADHLGLDMHQALDGSYDVYLEEKVDHDGDGKPQ